jgi:DNA-binding MarR family transcriptional regulator
MSRGIRSEIKQTKPFSGLEEEAFVSLMRTADRLQQEVTALLKEHGLSPTQFNALRILRGAGADGLPCSEVGERMISHDPDITRLLDRLERRGLVRRSRGQEDRRVIMACITPAGLDAIKPLDRPMEEYHRRSMKHIPKTQLKSLLNVLDTVRRGNSE